MPLMGMGLGVHLKGDAARRAVTDALAAGIRHVESAHEYENEEAIGAALRGSNVPREEIFITSKCCHNDPCDFTYEAAWAHVNRTLKDLGVEYVDHYAVHVPGISDAAAAKCGSEGRRGAGRRVVVRVVRPPRGTMMVVEVVVVRRCPSTSPAAARGVARHGRDKGRRVSAQRGGEQLPAPSSRGPAERPEVATQTRGELGGMASDVSDTDLREFCAARGITLTAFGSLPDYTRPVAGGGGKGGGGGGGGGGAKAKKAREVLERVAKGQGPAGVTAAQVTLRWATQRGVPVIPRSKSPQHLAQNVESLNLKLSDDDIASIDGLRVKSGAKEGVQPHFLTMP